jgi:Mg2+ and Co2+ transporter CorA
MDERRETSVSMAEVRFEDTQEIQVLQDKCQQLAHVLDMDRAILENMQSRFSLLPSINDIEEKAEVDSILSLIVEANIQMSRVNSTLQRLNGTIALIRTILDFRCLASLQHNSRIMRDVTSLTRKENALMVQLTKKASRDTDILKTITLLTLIYLPASFVSSMMGMNYINVDTVRNKLSIHLAGEFWVFLLLTAILLTFTLGSYYWYIRYNRADKMDDN